ncbi:17041_t:CDS:2 [Racocetra persica]|uniref:17041_t:CDS:1 n=1 Tax=Racocetra persica TaxID=160502 RepID=A0ACA9LMY9_9GLOM|nr:17041_t:CDS:2 [Racocetra persica]
MAIMLNIQKQEVIISVLVDLRNLIVMSHNIKSAKLENDKLIIEYNNNQQTETKDINDAELQQIKSFSQKIGKNELSISDLENTNTGSPSKNKGNNCWSWILGIGGVLGVIIIG